MPKPTPEPKPNPPPPPPPSTWRLIARAGAALSAARPDLVLTSGAISLAGESKESDLAAARALHEGIGLPLRFLPGNHDLGDSRDAAAHGGALITDERRARYLAHFGA